MQTQRFIVVSSATAYVDPSVQVHDAGCNHGLMRWYDEQWIGLGPFASDQDAKRAADNEVERVGAVDAMWCDCSLVRYPGDRLDEVAS